MKNSNVEPTATLKNLRRFEGDGWYIYYGDIYGDTKGRFPDGFYIHTSSVVDEDDEFIYTINSIYRKG